MKKKMKIAGMTATMLSSAGMTPADALADDLLQDAGSWMQIVGEGGLKVVDPSLDNNTMHHLIMGSLFINF